MYQQLAQVRGQPPGDGHVLGDHGGRHPRAQHRRRDRLVAEHHPGVNIFSVTQIFSYVTPTCTPLTL